MKDEEQLNLKKSYKADVPITETGLISLIKNFSRGLKPISPTKFGTKYLLKLLDVSSHILNTHHRQ